LFGGDLVNFVDEDKIGGLDAGVTKGRLRISME